MHGRKNTKLHFVVSLEIVGRAADRNSSVASIIVVRFIGTGRHRQSLVKLRNIKLQERPFGGSPAVRTDRQTHTTFFFLVPCVVIQLRNVNQQNALFKFMF